MALSLSRTPRPLLSPARAQPNNLSSMMDSVGAALTRVVFSPPSRDNAAVGTGAGGFPGKLPARHGAARRPFASAGPMQSNKNRMPPAASSMSPMASMSSLEEEEEEGRGGGGGGGDAMSYLGGALGRVFGGQVGAGDRGAPPTTGAIGWPGEAVSRGRQRRRGIGGGF
jgi:hypothetical protein